MSEFHVEVVRVGDIQKHENADSLGVTKVYDYPVIVRLGEFQPGDLAVYVPVDAIVPADDPRWEFLAGKRRIRAKKLRGVFSMGLLTKADAGMALGDDVAEAMRITKHDPEVPGPAHVPNYDGDLPDPGVMPTYTDIDALRRYAGVLEVGEEVVITEKIHGENFRATFADGQLWVGSRTRIKKPGVGWWWRAAESVGLAEKLAPLEGLAFYGECHGYTGGFPYATANGQASLRIFDVFDRGAGKYLDFDAAMAMVAEAGLESAPVLYRGPWDPAKATDLAEGMSTIDPTHVREGVVVRPVKERWHQRIGRVVLKLHGQGYLLKAS